MKKWQTFNKKELEEMAQESLNIKDFCLKMGYSPNNTHRREILEEIQQQYNIDFSKYNNFNKIENKKHKNKKTFRNKIEALPKEQFLEIINNSVNFKEVAIKIGYTDSSGQIINMIKRYAEKYGVSIDHLYHENILVGKIFGNLKVLKPETKGDKNKKWLCECQCENHTLRVVSTHILLSNPNISCGCKNKTKIIDLTGQRFGKLLVLERNKNIPLGQEPEWICQCDCGNIISAKGVYLRNRSKNSCGCLKESIGEKTIREILNALKIKYDEQYVFKNENNQYNKLRFDFAIYKNKEIQCFIEYQGSQHYFPFEYFGGEEGLNIRKERDYRKKILTQKYNIPLIEIPYTDLSKLNKEYFINLLKENNIDIIN